jgi:DNA-binding GntR family transcriptional regulator
MGSGVGMFQIEKKSILVESVTKQIREAIKLGRLKPGARLIETAIAEEMQVGRNAIREALRYLEKEGLVDMIPFKGAKVAQLTIKEMRDLFAVRSVLEELAIKSLAPIMDANKLTLLEKVVEDMKNVNEGASIQNVIDIDLNFHHTVCELSENKYLLEMWSIISNKIRVFIGSEDSLYGTDTPQVILSSHYPVFEAIKAGDFEKAAKLMRELIERGYLMASTQNRSTN